MLLRVTVEAHDSQYVDYHLRNSSKVVVVSSESACKCTKYQPGKAEVRVIATKADPPDH